MTKIRYEVSGDTSTVKIMRSYQEALKDAGAKTLFECRGWRCGSISTTIGRLPGGRVLDDDKRYGAFKLEQPGGQVFVSLLVSEVFDRNETVTFLHIIESEALQAGLVKVDAKQMHKDISAQGRATLYGVYFDTGKASLKPASADTLKEIKRLMAAHPDFDILVVGHTDNAGTSKG